MNTPTPLSQIQALRAELVAAFPERREVIDGAFEAVLAREHVLLLGPPGTAKSALVRAIAHAFGGVYFERLLTKFSTPEELFGPVSLHALEQDRYERVVRGKLPEAHFVLADECFKANSAILNTLLTAMNERLFHNDGTPLRIPLVTLFGASNELPEGKELEALFDRFLVRFDVGYLLRPANLRAVLRAAEPRIATQLTIAELEAAQAAAARVEVTDATIDALIAIRDSCKAEGLVASDRRWKKSLRVVQASAYLAGADATTPEDLLVLVDALWREPKERAKIARLVGELADPVSAQATEILDAARESAARAVRTQENKADFLSRATQALQAFKEQQAKLDQLARGAGRRAAQTIKDAQAEIAALHTDLARSVSAGLGLRQSA